MKQKLLILALGFAVATQIVTAQTECNLINSITLSATPTSSTHQTASWFYLDGADNLVVQDTTVWHYVAITKDDSNGSLYIDGKLKVSSTYQNVPYIWNSLLLGATQGCVSCSPIPNYLGKIDEVRISNSVRTTTEIQNNFTSNLPFTSDSKTLALFHFDTDNGNQLINSVDLTNGILYGTPEYVTGKFGNCLAFDGVTDYGRYTQSIPVNNVTLEFWFKSKDLDGIVAMFEYAYNTGFSLGSATAPNTLKWSNGEIGNSITINPTGLQSISVTDGNCDDTVYFDTVLATDTLVINTGLLSTNPTKYNNTVTIYPNPANEQITIDCGNLTNVSGWNIKIFNILSQEVFSGAMNQQQYTIPLNIWGGKGVYFVKIYDASNNVVNTKKIILQ